MQIPNKSQFKLEEVSSVTGVKPYVLRFWESEFDQINPLLLSDGNKVYGHQDIQVVAKIKEFLHPILGGSEKKGWEVGQDITIPDLFEFIKPDPEIGFISDLKIEALTPLYQPTVRPFTGSLSVWVQLADYEVLCSTTSHTISVTKA